MDARPTYVDEHGVTREAKPTYVRPDGPVIRTEYRHVSPYKRFEVPAPQQPKPVPVVEPKVVKQMPQPTAPPKYKEYFKPVYPEKASKPGWFSCLEPKAKTRPPVLTKGINTPKKNE